MDMNGNYLLTMSTPTGDRTMVLAVSDAGVRVGETGDKLHEVLDVVRYGPIVDWKMKVPGPMPLKLAFSVTIDGDVVTGECRLSVFPPSPVTGRRLR